MLLNVKQTAALLGIPRRTFDKWAKLGAFRHLLARRPVGQRIYDAERVQAYNDQRKLVDRRAS